MPGKENAAFFMQPRKADMDSFLSVSFLLRHIITLLPYTHLSHRDAVRTDHRKKVS
jgi:hypothetical protein